RGAGACRRPPRRRSRRRGRGGPGAASAGSCFSLYPGCEVPQQCPHVEQQQRGQGEALGHRYRGEARGRQGEDLALLGADVDLFGRLIVSAVGGGEQGGRVLAPPVRIAIGREDGPLAVEDRGPAQVRRHLVEEGERLLGGRLDRSLLRRIG